MIYTFVLVAFVVYLLVSKQRLYKIATQDALTKINNRRVFDQQLERRLSKRNNNFSLIWLDVDNFKIINDTYGHAAGDKALQLIAQSLKQNTRKGDVVTRVGGDEFAVLLNKCPLEELQQVIKRIKKQCERDGYSVSIGSKIIVNEKLKVQQLLADVDQLMYKEKRQR